MSSLYLASTSAQKRQALEAVLKTLGITFDQIYYCDSDSGVPAQPIGTQMLAGAQNRIASIVSRYSVGTGDIVIAIENGLVPGDPTNPDSVTIDQGLVYGQLGRKRVFALSDFVVVPNELVAPSLADQSVTWGDTAHRHDPNIDPKNPHPYFVSSPSGEFRQRWELLVDPLVRVINTLLSLSLSS